VLEQWALRFLNKQQTNSPYDQELALQVTNALTIPAQIDGIPFIDSNPYEHTSEQEAIQHFLNQRPDILEPIGIIPGKKTKRVIRLLYENQKRLLSQLVNNRKLDKAKDNINFQHQDCRRTGFTTLYNGGECLIKGLGGSNRHIGGRLLGRQIQGGTGMVAFGEVASWMKNDFSGMDDTGLARWTYMTFSGQDGRAITLVKHLLLQSKHAINNTDTILLPNGETTPVPGSSSTAT
ncbi:hypothetical protein ACHAWX_002256, partial [Stephanocyclus meneghinianus]